MNYVNVIDNISAFLKNGDFNDVLVKYEKEDENFNNAYNCFNKVSGIFFSSDIQNLYQQRPCLKIKWRRFEHIGWFEMLPIDRLVYEHDNLLELIKSYAEDDKDFERFFNMFENMYPILEFASGDKLCIHSQTGKVLYYDMTFAEKSGLDINGIVFAKNYDYLIEKWSKIFFLEGFWWYKDYDRCLDVDGINIDNQYFNNFWKELNIENNTLKNLIHET